MIEYVVMGSVFVFVLLGVVGLAKREGRPRADKPQQRKAKLGGPVVEAPRVYDRRTACHDCGKVGYLRVFFYDKTGRLIQCKDCDYYWIEPNRNRT